MNDSLGMVSSIRGRCDAHVSKELPRGLAGPDAACESWIAISALLHFCAYPQVAANAAQVVLVGIPEVDFLQYNPHVARTKELTILNARRANQTLATCLELLSSSVQLREKCLAMLTHRLPLSNFNCK